MWGTPKVSKVTPDQDFAIRLQSESQNSIVWSSVRKIGIDVSIRCKSCDELLRIVARYQGETSTYNNVAIWLDYERIDIVVRIGVKVRVERAIEVHPANMVTRSCAVVAESGKAPTDQNLAIS